MATSWERTPNVFYFPVEMPIDRLLENESRIEKGYTTLELSTFYIHENKLCILLSYLIFQYCAYHIKCIRTNPATTSACHIALRFYFFPQGGAAVHTAL